MRFYGSASRDFRTPKGNTVTMTYRPDTSDWNTIWSCLPEDEYGLARLDLTGFAADIGGHIGGVTLALLADNPALHVIAIEAVPENAELLWNNVEANGFGDRATVINGAAGKEAGTARIHYRYTGNETAEHHAFIGNIGLFPGFGPDNCPNEIPHEHADVPVVPLADLVDNRLLSFMKIDCEGGEWDFFDTEPANLRRLARIHGEWHPTTGHTQADFTALLPGFEITYTGPEAGPQGFAAVLR